MSARWRVRLPLGALACLALLAIGAPWLAPMPPNAIPADGLIQSLPPSLEHPFGTDPLGRDVLSRLLHGARLSLSVAFLSVALASLVGASYGVAAGWIGGRVDTLCMRLLDVALAVPRLLVLLIVSALWGTLPLSALVLLLGLTGWYDVARLVRSDVRALRDRDFVMAARATGVREARIVWRHVVPHLWPTLVVTATLGVANTIALEAGVSFLGLGVQPPQASWGTILSDGHLPGGARWWLTLFPGVAIVLTTLTCNALGDALREALAPRQVGA
jgi:peptide/nickel transport system permease protein